MAISISETAQFRRIARAALLTWGVALSACTSPAARLEPAPSPAAAEAYQAGLRELWLGNLENAKREWGTAVELEPRFVAAHRQIQNLGLAERRRGELLQLYRRLRDDAPRDSRVLYLWGRLHSDVGRQERAFEEALRLEPRSPWPFLGLGHLALARGEVAEARRHFEAGLRWFPEHRELVLGAVQLELRAADFISAFGRLTESDGDPQDEYRLRLLAETHGSLGNTEKALRVLGQSVARSPGNAVLCDQLLARFLHSGTSSQAVWLLRMLQSASDLSHPSLHRLLMHVASASGDAALALQMASKLPSLSLAEHQLRRRLLFQAGRWIEALENEENRYDGLSGIGFDCEVFRRAQALATSAQSESSAEARLRFARLLRRMGMAQEALIVVRSLEVVDAELEQFLADTRGQLRLEAEWETLAKQRYHEFQSGADRLSLEEFRGQLSMVTKESLGIDLVAGAEQVSFGPLGAMLDPDPQTGGPFARHFFERGRLLIVGRRVGSPPELMMLPALHFDRAGPQNAHLAFVEGVRVPSYLHFQNAQLTGAALHRFAYVDVGQIDAEAQRVQVDLKKWDAEAGRIFAEPLSPADDQTSRRSLKEPAEVAFRLRWHANRRAESQGSSYFEDLVEQVLVHEIAHLNDAHEFFSSKTGLWQVLGAFVRKGFSVAKIEAWLEMRAQCAAILRGRNPHLGLATCADYLPRSRGGESPHATGYEELMERFVEILDREPERFPMLRRDSNLLQQLDRLTASQIRAVAGEIAEDLALP